MAATVARLQQMVAEGGRERAQTAEGASAALEEAVKAHGEELAKARAEVEAAAAAAAQRARDGEETAGALREAGAVPLCKITCALESAPISSYKSHVVERNNLLEYSLTREREKDSARHGGGTRWPNTAQC